MENIAKKYLKRNINAIRFKKFFHSHCRWEKTLILLFVPKFSLTIPHNTPTITIAVQIVQGQHQQHWYLYQLAPMLGRIYQFFTLLLFHSNRPLMPSNLLSLYFLAYARNIAGVFSWRLPLPPSCSPNGNILLIDRRSKPKQGGLCPRYIWLWRPCIRGKLSWPVPISECRCSKRYDWIIQKLPALCSDWVVKDILTDGAVKMAADCLRVEEGALLSVFF